jgi:hypothetical protein
MAVRLLDEITWDGQALMVAAATDDGRVICRVPRETIHVLSIYSDSIGREIELERRKIVEKLAPFLIAKVSQAEAGETAELLPSDVRD